MCVCELPYSVIRTEYGPRSCDPDADLTVVRGSRLSAGIMRRILRSIDYDLIMCAGSEFSNKMVDSTGSHGSFGSLNGGIC